MISFSSFDRQKISIGEYYVYMLVDPRNGIPFYVGKGKKRRYAEHLTKSGISNGKNKGKINRILEIRNEGLLVEVKIVQRFSDERNSLLFEEFLIEAIGLKKFNRGPLLNLQRGSTNQYGFKRNNGDMRGENNPMWGLFGENHPAFGIKHSKESIDRRVSKLKETLRKNPPLGERNSNYGNRWTEEQKRNLSDKRKGAYSGSKNPRAKKFLFISPDGIEHIVIGNLKNFCTDNGISYFLVYKAKKNGKDNCNGWVFREIKDDSN